MSSPSTTDAAPSDAPAEERDDLRQGLLDRLRAELGDAVVGTHLLPGVDVWARVTREAWLETGELVQRGLGCKFFDFLSGIDWLPSPYGRELDSEIDVAPSGREAKEPAPMVSGYAGGDTRFQVLARVYDTAAHVGLTLKADLPDDDLSIASWSKLYLGANWHEREAHEMFGFTFVGHPWLANLYLPTEFEGYPLRKDFPLLSRRVKPWPGIVDVEPMPGQDDAEGEGPAESGGAE